MRLSAMSVSLGYLHNRLCYTPVKPKIITVPVITTCQGNVKIKSRQGRWRNNALASASLFLLFWLPTQLGPLHLVPGLLLSLQESPNLRHALLQSIWHQMARLHSPRHCSVHVAPGSAPKRNSRSLSQHPTSFSVLPQLTILVLPPSHSRSSSSPLHQRGPLCPQSALLIPDSDSAKRTFCLAPIILLVLCKLFPNLNEIVLKTSESPKPKLLPHPNIKLIPHSVSDCVMVLTVTYLLYVQRLLGCAR